jgi:hypothetical protein
MVFVDVTMVRTVVNKRFSCLGILAMVTASVLLASCSYTHPDLRRKPSRKVVSKPQVTIHNHSQKDIVVGVDGPESRFIEIPEGEHRKIYLKSGNYKYAVAAEHISPVTGHKTFKPNHRYTWNFGVKQMRGLSF